MVTKSMAVGGMSERDEESPPPPPSSFMDLPSGTSLEWSDSERRPGTIFFSRAPIPTAARWAVHNGTLVRRGPASRAVNNSRREDDGSVVRLLVGRQRRRLFLSVMVLVDVRPRVSATTCDRVVENMGCLFPDTIVLATCRDNFYNFHLASLKASKAAKQRVSSSSPISRASKLSRLLCS